MSVKHYLDYGIKVWAAIAVLTVFIPTLQSCRRYPPRLGNRPLAVALPVGKEVRWIFLKMSRYKFPTK